MKGTILETIINSKRERVEAAKRAVVFDALRDQAAEKRDAAAAGRFAQAVGSRSRINVIAEFKRASPSKGILNRAADPAITARSYERAGAAAVSVLTEEDHFLGSLGDLTAVRAAVSLPVLRKDFIFDEYQVVESAAAGADAVLLIASLLHPDELARLLECVKTHALDAIVEVHDRRELDIAVSSGASIIGVNNRDLRSFVVDLNVSRSLIAHAPADGIMISESGITSAAQIRELYEMGFSAFLIGESLMRSNDLENQLTELAGLNGLIGIPEIRSVTVDE